MNREVFGEYTDNFLAMRLPIEAVRSRDISENVAAHIVEGTNYIQVHPHSSMESVESDDSAHYAGIPQAQKVRGRDLSVVLRRLWSWQILDRRYRTDTLFIPGTTLAVSQVLSLCMVIFAVVTDIVVRMHLKNSRKWKKLKFFKIY